MLLKRFWCFLWKICGFYFQQEILSQSLMVTMERGTLVNQNLTPLTSVVIFLEYTGFIQSYYPVKSLIWQFDCSLYKSDWIQICVLGIKPRDCSKNGDQWRRPVILVEEVNEKRSNRLNGENQVLRRAKVSDICTIDV